MFITSKAKADVLFAVSIARGVRVSFIGANEDAAELRVSRIRQRDVRVAFDQDVAERNARDGSADDTGAENRCGDQASGYENPAAADVKVEWPISASDFPTVLPL